jgi:hypothetical protein
MTSALQFVALLGAPRSGTTWLQALLGSQDAVVSPQETDLFRLYLAPLAEAWDAQVRATTDPSTRAKGLPLLLTQREFDAAVRSVVDVAVKRLHELKPSASIVVEKTPSHSLHVDTILRFVPETRVLHIVRDGRDVAASMMNAAEQDWGAHWAAGSIGAAARVWRDHVIGARGAKDRAPYLEVRYEDLKGPLGPSVLRAAFEFIGAPIELERARALLAEHSLERVAAVGEVAPSILTGDALPHTRQEPDGFFGTGGQSTWQRDWSVGDRRRFAEVASELLIELGYERDTQWAGGRRPALLTRAAHRTANAAAATLRGLANRIEQIPLRGRPRPER